MNLRPVTTPELDSYINFQCNTMFYKTVWLNKRKLKNNKFPTLVMERKVKAITSIVSFLVI